ncbi:hypothetical protein pb186bvf_011697 [Paramecium bursaria]
MNSMSLTPQTNRKTWTPDEDKLLSELRQNKGLDWIEVARQIEGRNPSQCAQRWKRIKGYKLRRQWTPEEDQKVKNLVEQYGQHWSKISQFLPHRTGKQIREHYLNQLHPDLNNDPWSTEEDEKIIDIYKTVGGKWSQIQKELKGRSENSIKNRFYSFLRGKYLNIKNPYYIVPEKKKKIEKTEEQIKEIIDMPQQAIPIQYLPSFSIYPYPTFMMMPVYFYPQIN